ncbi:MAG TPA: PSD1 and planctomycete cytochrome C domain-containing protein [Pirellulaceae bacterium]|nr:PSD1 and planctomycete cytochrome C domain-containing protein [Pirellulaceae bacterium]
MSSPNMPLSRNSHRTTQPISNLILVAFSALFASVSSERPSLAQEKQPAASVDGAQAANAAQVEFFEKRVRPLLAKRCYECHGAETAEGKLRLDTKSGWERGGDRGPAIVPGDPSASLLIRAVTMSDSKLKMPPPDSGAKLTEAEIADLTTWIRQGAHDPRVGGKIVTNIDKAAAQHWAFQPLAPPAVDPASHPIDQLIDRKLAERKFEPTAPADMHTLVRRAAFDLLGLPPSAEQLKTARENFPQLVKEMLASPRYGERWGRHWLDVARYSDAKDGVLMYGDARIRPFAYTYRDYVIRTFNDDKPVDQFIREQLAADQLNLPADSPDLAAMGLLTLGRMFDSNRHDVIDDQIDVVGRGFLGLSLACARCHDHKFDPVPTADYYSLYGVFASSIEPFSRPRIAPVTEAGQAYENEFAAKLKEITDQQQAHYESTLKIARERTPDYLVQVATTEPDVAETTIFFLSLIPDQLRPQITKRWRQLIARRAFPDDKVFGPWHDLMRDPTALKPDDWKSRGVDQRIIDGLVAAKPTSKADVARAYGAVIRDAWTSGAGESDALAGLLVGRDGPIWFPIRDVASYLSRQPGDAFRGLLGQLDAISVKHKDAAARAMVVQDTEVLCDPVIFQRGDPSARGTPVPRRFLSILSPPDRPTFKRGGGRLDLAESITAPTNPLTARVWVNRVWMHHFGESLVDNPGDFGLQAKRPVQLDLLDYLADYFIKHGWRTKPLHELIMTSRAYQRSSSVPDNEQMTMQRRTDSGNSLIWRANRRRLDLEQMRDTLLSVSGELDLTMYGRPSVITDDANRRRTIYSFVERQNIPAMVQTFDFANADTSTPRRNMTTVPQQALFALNSNFMLARADALAKRTADVEGAAKVARLYQLTLGREPTAPEREQCEAFLASGSVEQLAQVLLMTNELMFVD